MGELSESDKTVWKHQVRDHPQSQSQRELGITTSSDGDIPELWGCWRNLWKIQFINKWAWKAASIIRNRNEWSKGQKEETYRWS